MTLRASLEVVLKKHLSNGGVIDFSRPCSSCAHHIGCCQKCKLLDDLLACFPQPSREVLRELFKGRGYNIFCRNGSENHNVGGELANNNPGCHPSACECRVDSIMTWAIGQWERTTWCSHMEHLTSRMKQLDIPTPLLTNIRQDVDSWKFCPTCAAKRPSEQD